MERRVAVGDVGGSGEGCGEEWGGEERGKNGFNPVTSQTCLCTAQPYLLFSHHTHTHTHTYLALAAKVEKVLWICFYFHFISEC